MVMHSRSARPSICLRSCLAVDRSCPLLVPRPRIDQSRILFLLAMLINLWDREGCLCLAIQKTSPIATFRESEPSLPELFWLPEWVSWQQIAELLLASICQRVDIPLLVKQLWQPLMSSKCSTVALSGPDKSLSDVSPRIWIRRQNKQGHALCLSNLRAWTRLPFVWSSIVSSAWDFLHLVLSMK